MSDIIIDDTIDKLAQVGCKFPTVIEKEKQPNNCNLAKPVRLDVY